MAGRDWEAFARTLEDALDMRTKGGFRELFAPGARFADPANAPTEDLRDIQQQTRAVMPDWKLPAVRLKMWAFGLWLCL